MSRYAVALLICYACTGGALGLLASSIMRGDAFLTFFTTVILLADIACAAIVTAIYLDPELSR